jgi:hypothetical protein
MNGAEVVRETKRNEKEQTKSKYTATTIPEHIKSKALIEIE